LGERLLCKQNVAGSIPVISTKYCGISLMAKQQISNLRSSVRF